MKAMTTSVSLTATSLFTAMLLFVGSPAHAEEGWHRKGTWEVYGSGQYLIGDTEDFSKFGVRVDIDEDGRGAS